MGGIAKPALIFQEPSSPLLPSLWSHPRVKGDFVVTEHHEQERWEENHPYGGEVSERVPETCGILLVLHSLGQHPSGALVALEFVPVKLSPYLESLQTASDSWLRVFGRTAECLLFCLLPVDQVCWEHSYAQVLDVCLLSLGIDRSLQIVPMGFFFWEWCRV